MRIILTPVLAKKCLFGLFILNFWEERFAMSQPIAVTDENFAVEVLEADLPVLVDFWAAWCGPCRMIAPIVTELADEYAGKAKICKMDVDTSQQIAAEFGIRSIPTLLLFKHGKVVDQVIGAVPKSQITEKLDAIVAS